MAIESSTTSSISPWRYKTQGSVWSSKWTVVWKSAGSPFPGTSMRQSALAIESDTTSSISSWRYKTQGSVWSSKWTVEWKSAGSPFPGTYKQCAKCASKSRLWL